MVTNPMITEQTPFVDEVHEMQLKANRIANKWTLVKIILSNPCFLEALHCGTIILI